MWTRAPIKTKTTTTSQNSMLGKNPKNKSDRRVSLSVLRFPRISMHEGIWIMDSPCELVWQKLCSTNKLDRDQGMLYTIKYLF